MNITILGAGHAVPRRMVTNAELERRWSLPEGWIERRTGIKRRPWVEPEEATSDLAVAAGLRALERAAVDPADIDLVILATSTPDHLLPPTAPRVAHLSGCVRAGAFDLTGACCGFLFGLSQGESHVRARGGKVLVIGANVLSRRVRPEDPNTGSLFSDGAGAVVLGPVERQAGLCGYSSGSNGALWDSVYIAEGGSRSPFAAETFARGGHLMDMKNGGGLFREAVGDMARVGIAAMDKAEWSRDEVDWWVPHQANARMIEEVRKTLSLPETKTVRTIEHYGNSSAGTIPIALSLCMEDGRLNPGHRLLMTAVGAGMLRIGIAWRL